MTTIAGIAQDRQVWIGGDSMSSSDQDTQVVTNPKVLRLAGPNDEDILIGFSGSWRMGQLIEHSLKVPAWKKGTLESYLSTAFVDALRKCLKDGGYALGQDDGAENLSANFLLGFHGRLFEVHTNYCVLEGTDGFSSVGSGYRYALGSLHATRHNPSAVDRITVALEAATAFNAYVGGPIRIEYLDDQGAGLRVA
jgi:ATP-dependent protease HslVU (ClpYQ) peptidase subunit